MAGTSTSDVDTRFKRDKLICNEKCPFFPLHLAE